MCKIKKKAWAQELKACRNQLALARVRCEALLSDNHVVKHLLHKAVKDVELLRGRLLVYEPTFFLAS